MTKGSKVKGILLSDTSVHVSVRFQIVSTADLFRFWLTFLLFFFLATAVQQGYVARPAGLPR